MEEISLQQQVQGGNELDAFILVPHSGLMYECQKWPGEVH